MLFHLECWSPIIILFLSDIDDYRRWTLATVSKPRVPSSIVHACVLDDQLIKAYIEGHVSYRVIFLTGPPLNLLSVGR